MPSYPTQVQTNTSAKKEAPAEAPQKKKVVPLIPFSRAAKKHIELGPTFVKATPWGGNLIADIPTYGFMSGICITVDATGGVDVGETVAIKEDAPWNVFNNLLLADTNGAPIFNISGYEAYLAMLYGGQVLFKSEGSTFGFTAVAVGASASGNFKFKLYIWQEFGRDGLGCMPNQDASAKYRLTMSLASPADFYSVQPDTPPTLNVFVELLARSKPSMNDAFGMAQQQLPPSPGSVQYWTSQQFNLAAGNNTPQLSKVGNLIRNHILIFKDATGTRAIGETNVVPTSVELQWDNGQIYTCRTDTLRTLAYQLTGINPPNGVVPLLYTGDTESFAGSELGDDWLPTVASTKLQFKFSCANPGTLTVVTNDIVPGDGNIFAAPLMQLGGM